MKVFFINSFFSVGGPPHIVNGICDALEKNGDDYLLAAAREKAIPGMKTIKIGNDICIYSAALQSRIFDNEGFSSKRATKKLINIINEYKPDIIHLHNLHGYYINVEILFSYLKHISIPVVWTLHDCWAMTGHCCHFSYIKCNKWINDGCNHCPQKKEYPSSLIIDNSAANYRRKKATFVGVENLTITVVSQWLKSIVMKSFLKGYPIEVIYNGINNDVFYHRETKNHIERFILNMQIEKKIILGVAQNWGERKGLNDFLKLSRIISEDYTIILIGITREHIQNEYANIYCIEKTTDQNELAEWYSIATVFLNLSYEETFGLVTAEALSCQTPVVVYDSTATSEIVKNGYNGFVVEPGNINSVWDSIQRIHTIDKQNCKCDYTESIMKNNYLNLYKKLNGGIQ